MYNCETCKYKPISFHCVSPVVNVIAGNCQHPDMKNILVFTNGKKWFVYDTCSIITNCNGWDNE
jgi:hypothetical protein